MLQCEEMRAWVRISYRASQTLAAPGGLQCVDIILRHPGLMLRKSVGAPPHPVPDQHLQLAPWPRLHAKRVERVACWERRVWRRALCARPPPPRTPFMMAVVRL